MKRLVDPFRKALSTQKTYYILLVFLGYSLFFFPLFAIADRQAVVFFIFPTIIIALLGGRWWGLAAGLLYAPINRLLFILVNTTLIDYQGSRNFWFTYLIFPVIGFSLGYFRDKNKQLEEKLPQQVNIDVAPNQSSITNESGIYKQIVENAMDTVVLTDLDGNITYVNQYAIEMHGYSREELIGKSIQFLDADGEQGKTEQMFRIVLLGKSAPVNFERMVRHKDGSVFPVEVNMTLVSNLMGKPLYVQCIARYITDRKLVEEALKASEASLKKAQQLAHVGNWEWHLDDNAFWISEEMCRIYGLQENDKFHEVHTFIQNTAHPDDLDRVRKAMRYFRSGQNPEQGISYRIERPRGEIRWVKLSAAETKSVDIDGNPSILIGMVQDITEQVEVEENLQHLATHDSLTDLPNRALFYDRLSHAIARANRDQRCLAVLFLDLDGFKMINDTSGHLVGDQLLKFVADRLLGCIRGGDTVARMGGDEFTIILEDVGNKENTQIAIDNIISKLSKPYSLDKQEISITASIGVALFPYDAGEAPEILQKADQAMYAAKDDARKENWYHFYQDLN